MRYIVKLFPEIIVKSKPVRKRLIAQLKKNLRRLTQRLSINVEVVGGWDHIELIPQDIDQAQLSKLEDLLASTPGIGFSLRVDAWSFKHIDDIVRISIKQFAEQLAGKTFCVRVKRSGKHAFNSTQVEQKVGGALLHNSDAAGVKLKDPEVEVKLEIRQDKLFTVVKKIEGLGGFPLGQQDACLSLISGGYDSSVASFMMMKRGIRTHFCFFNLGGVAHEVGVKQLSHYLWEHYSASHRVLFITVPFVPVVDEILQKIHHSQMGVVLKRMMLRAASKIAEQFHIQALVTGECVGQVSSQTMTNLAVIDEATDMLTLRPLISMDKQDIIDMAKRCGSEEFAAVMPEYCGVISDKPTTAAKLEKIREEEAKFDFGVLDTAVQSIKVQNIDELFVAALNMEAVEVIEVPRTDDIVLDIRHPHEVEVAPLKLTKNEIITLPFFKLASAQLDKHRSYALYCDKGIMSQLQAETLKQQGYQVKVYRPVT